MMDELEKIIKEIKQLSFVEDAWLDDDCIHEGAVGIEITLKEES